MKRCFPILIFVLFIFSSQAFSVEKTRIAILDLKAKGVPERMADAVTDLIKSDIVNSNYFDVVERQQMDQILSEIGFQQAGCTDQSCAIQVGKLLSAKKILMGEVTRLGNSIIITTRIVDVEKGLAEQAAKEKAESEEALEATSARLAANIINLIRGERAVQDAAGKPAPLEAATETSKINPYLWQTVSSGAASAVFLLSGIIMNMQVGNINDDITSLGKEYNSATTTDAEAAKIKTKIEDKQDKADRYSIIRNLFYGFSGASAAVMGYYLYQYFTYAPGEDAALNFSNPVVIPVCWYNPDNKNSGEDRFYLGAGLTAKF